MGQLQIADRDSAENRRGVTRAAACRVSETSAKRWIALSHEWERSGLSQVDYCRQRGLAVASLRWWRWRLGTRARLGKTRTQLLPASSTPSASFVPVELVRETAEALVGTLSPSVEIVLRRQRRVRIRGDFDALVLARIVKVLEAIP